MKCSLYIPSDTNYSTLSRDFHQPLLKPMICHPAFFSFQKTRGNNTETVIVNAPDKEKALEAIAFDLLPEDKKTIQHASLADLINGLETGTITKCIIINDIQNGQITKTKDLLRLHSDNKTALLLFFKTEAKEKDAVKEAPYTVSEIAITSSAKRREGMGIYTRHLQKEYTPA